MLQKVVPLALTVAILALPAAAAPAKVRAVSTDGEATVYLVNDFAQGFDLSYTVDFPESRRNRSWTTVSLLLLGRASEGGSIAVGLARGNPNERTLSGFTDIARPNSSPVYRSVHVICDPVCDVGLRGTAKTISAFINRNALGLWSRSELRLTKPYVQINGEVSAVGDRLAATLIAMRTEVDGRTLDPPACAFSTQGVRVSRVGTGIQFYGSRAPESGATYVSLIDGSTGDRCPRAPKTTPASKTAPR